MGDGLKTKADELPDEREGNAKIELAKLLGIKHSTDEWFEFSGDIGLVMAKWRLRQIRSGVLE